MDRIIKIAIYVAILFFVSIWISSVIKSCNAPSDTITEVSDVDDDTLDDFEDDFFEDNLGDGENTYDSDMGGGTIESDDIEEDFAADYTEIDRVLEESHETYTKPSTTNNNQKSRSTGKYMVLAGSYLIKDNAQSMISKLGNLGYGNAEIVIFNMSQYHSVCAARLSDYNEAMQLSSELQRRGIDNYVHNKH